jgi:hypothetical protein
VLGFASNAWLLYVHCVIVAAEVTTDDATISMTANAIIFLMFSFFLLFVDAAL